MLKAFVVVQCSKKVPYWTDRIIKLRDNPLLADFVIEATKQSEPQSEGGR